MHSTDRPITTAENDLLGRATFSKRLGQAIYSYDGEDSIAIALYGKWGSGKTSVINMALQEVEELSKNDEKKPIIMHFSPWNYSAKENLTLQFFSCLKAKVESPEDGTWIDAVTGLAATIPGIGNIVSTILKKKLTREKSFEEIRTSLKKILIDYKGKIIVVIDDIDRMSNDQIRDIFQLVKQFANFQHTIYLLAMDKEIVARALSDVQKCDGEEYLEKIIQIPFVIPEADRQGIQDVFLKLLDEIIEKKQYQIQWEQGYWHKVFENCIQPYLSNVRDISRIFNTLVFRMGILKEEICFEDILSLTVMEVLEPKAFQWVADNEELVCGGEIYSLAASKSSPEEHKRKYLEAFKSLQIAQPETALRAIAAIFPAFAEYIGEVFWEYEAPDEYNTHKRMRVAQRDHYELFFSMNINRVRLSRSTIMRFIRSLQPEAMIRTVDEIDKLGEVPLFINELHAHIDEVPHERLAVLIDTMCRLQSELNGEEHHSLFYTTTYQLASGYVAELFKRIGDKNKCFEIIEKLVRTDDANTLAAIGIQISVIESAYGSHADQEAYRQYQWITREQLEQIRKDFSQSMKQLSGKQDILDVEQFNELLILWFRCDEKAADEFLNERLKDTDNCLKYLCRMSSMKTGAKGRGWKYYNGLDNAEVSEKNLAEAIRSYDKKQLVSRYSQKDLLKIASLYLNAEKGSTSEDVVDERTAKELVKNWTEGWVK